MKKTDKAAKQLYQLFAKKQVPDGAYVGVNGPWDTYGVVLSSKQEEGGQWLHQIRGVSRRPGEKVVHNF